MINKTEAIEIAKSLIEKNDIANVIEPNEVFLRTKAQLIEMTNDPNADKEIVKDFEHIIQDFEDTWVVSFPYTPSEDYIQDPDCVTVLVDAKDGSGCIVYGL